MDTETTTKTPSMNKNLLTTVLSYILVVLFSGVLVGVGYYINEKMASKTVPTVTVVGVANSEKDNKLAYFTADITKKNEDKQVAVTELNEASKAAIDAIKGFGIDEKDVKTNFFNVYQNSEWDPVTQQSKMTDWSASISIEVKLQDVNRAGELGTLLATLDTTYLTGPNFSLDPDAAKNNDLLKEAIEDARSKAEDIALVSNRKLGKVLSVDETNAPQGLDTPMFKEAMGMGMVEDAISFDAGTTDVSKSVTVTFELK